MNARDTLLTAAVLFSLGVAIPLWGANPRTPVAATKPAAAKLASLKTTATKPAATKPAPAPAPVARGNPLLPPSIPVESFFIDLSVVQKLPAIAPRGYEPIYTSEDWTAYRTQFGAEADDVTRLKSSGQAEFADKMLHAATDAPAAGKTPTAGLQRLLLLRAASIGYRNKDGYPVANKAVAAYIAVMDKRSATQVGGLWTISNIMARTSVTPKEDRIRYDAIAARANMQLALLMLDVDQVAAAESIIKQIGYHEGWLKKDATTRGQIASVRAEVKRVVSMMDYLATQYQPAIHNDVSALTVIYLYGKYVKAKPTSVEDLPGRVPGSSLSQLATSLDAAGTGTSTKPEAAFAAAEKLRQLATTIPDILIRHRTLYAAMQLYDVYMNAPQTERDRVNRTIARIAREGVISDGARKAHSIDPFAVPATTQPAQIPVSQPHIETTPHAVG